MHIHQHTSAYTQDYVRNKFNKHDSGEGDSDFLNTFLKKDTSGFKILIFGFSVFLS